MKTTTIGMLAIMVTQLTACTQETKTDATPQPASTAVMQFTPPTPEGTTSKFIANLHKAGEEFKAYGMTTNPTPIEVRAMALTVINSFRIVYSMKVANSTEVYGFNDLTEDEHNAMTKVITEACSTHLATKCKIEKTARYGIAVIIEDAGKSMRFDANQNATAIMNISVILLDTEAKQILWHSPTGVSYSRWSGKAIEAAGRFICDELDTLFKGK